MSKVLPEEEAWKQWAEQRDVRDSGNYERCKLELTQLAAKHGVLKGRYKRLSQLTRRVLTPPQDTEFADYDHALDELRTILMADEAAETR